MTLSGWLSFLVFCNNTLIASFSNEKQRNDFMAKRRERFPGNNYTTEYWH